MKKTFLLTFVFILGTASLIKANMQDSVLIKHDCKIIEHGFFSFYTFDDDKAIIKNVFSYSLNLKKQTSVVTFIESDTIKVDSMAKNSTEGFYNSKEWNKKRIGTSVEKYFLLFHPEFLKWNNAQKLDFFIQTHKKK
ncbi:MAG: hypothetical protein K9J21_04925 [Bacteroidales bacterium]|nr:hypothetical protein [Bacteroidales bacterium]